jgi:hypothetical protein
MFLVTEIFHVKDRVYCIEQFCLSCNGNRQACFVTLHELFFIVLSVTVPVICVICVYVCIYVCVCVCVYVYIYTHTHTPPLCCCLSYICFFVKEGTVIVPVHVIKACG